MQSTAPHWLASGFSLLERLGESVWQRNLKTGEIWISPGIWEDQLGYDPSLLPITHEAARELTHPLDLDLAEEEIELHIRSDEPFEVEIRFRAADAEWHFMRMRGCVVGQGPAEPGYVGGIMTDVTKLVFAARARLQAEVLVATLSTRESQVLSCLVAGAASKNIAYGLGISQRTVEGYRARVMEKLGVHGVGDLVQLAIAGGVTAASAADCGQSH
jgi:DNA-binding CsgD family transcriptional regulator